MTRPTPSAGRARGRGVGQGNAADLGVLPAHGLSARHVTGLTPTLGSFHCEKRDRTPALRFDDMLRAKTSDVK